MDLRFITPGLTDVHPFALLYVVPLFLATQYGLSRQARDKPFHFIAMFQNTPAYSRVFYSMQKDKCAVKSHVTPLVDIERLNQSTNLKNRRTINDTASCFLGSIMHSSNPWVDIIMLPCTITLM